MHRQFCKAERPDGKAQNNKEGQNMEQHSDQIRARITGTGNLLREIFACLFPVLGTLYAFSHAAVVLYLCAGVTGGYLPSGTSVPQPIWILLYFLAALGSSYLSAGRCLFLNADKHSPASSARSDCVHEQVVRILPAELPTFPDIVTFPLPFVHGCRSSKIFSFSLSSFSIP